MADPQQGSFVSWARLLRPMNAAMTGLAVATGAIVAVGAGSLLGAGAPAGTPARVLLAMMAGFAATAAGNVANDLGDVETDRIAHPERALVTGALSLRAAMMTLVALAIATLALAILVSPGALALASVALVLLGVYELRSKERGLEGNLLVAILAGAPFLLGALAVRAPLAPLPLVVGTLAAVATLGREILKDLEDAPADAARRTLPRTAGARAARVAARASLLAAVVLSPLPYALQSVIGWPYLALVAVADAGFVAAAVLAASPGRAQRLTKLSMLVALVAFIAGRS
ncbi:MAG: geranylgeranylglycerol-phosphate geranylgeranyltransferase [Thermoplasmatota archaeon]